MAAGPFSALLEFPCEWATVGYFGGDPWSCGTALRVCRVRSADGCVAG